MIVTALVLAACTPAPASPAPVSPVARSPAPASPTPRPPVPASTAPRSPTTQPSASSTAKPAPSPSPTSLSADWQVIRPGLEFLRTTARVNEIGNVIAVARLDPARFDIRVRYAPQSPLTVREWQSASAADVVVNAGYYTPEGSALGLLISDGRAFGQTSRGFGGMFSVRDGKATLQWLARQPYVVDRRITQAIQSFPMLVHAGNAVDGIQDEGWRSFRTFAGIDAQGRVLFGVAQIPLWTLTDLAQYLADDPALNVTTALNLDGGGSTGLWLAGAPESMLMNSIDPVPAVITVSAR